jgi:hypothetical protein
MNKALLLILVCISFGLKGQVELNFIQKKSGSDLTYICVVEKFEDMMGFQGTLTWNPDTMSYNTIEFSEFISSAMTNPKMVSKGHLPLIWLTVDGPLTLEPCDTLFTLKFVDKLGLSSLTFGDQPVSTEFVNMSGVASWSSDLVAACGLTAIKERRSNERFELIPNIVDSGQHFKVWSTATKPLEFILYNPRGQQIIQHKGVLNKKMNAPKSAGLYFYVIKDGNAVLASGKLVVI